MVNGFALGGVAQGFDRAAQTGLQEDRVALAERQFESNEEFAIKEQGDKRIAESLRFVSDTIKQAKAAGASPEKIERLIAPVMKSIGDISTKIGRDPGSIINAVKASINAPVAQKPPEIVEVKPGSMFRDPRTGELTEISSQSEGAEPKNIPVSGKAGERKVGSFVSAMVDAEKVLRENTISNVPFDNTAVSAIRDRSETLANFFRTSEGRRYTQAARQWIRARLRKESGATISDTEFAGEFATFFPQPGDDPATIERKRQARVEAMRSMAAEAGPGFGRHKDLTDVERAIPGGFPETITEADIQKTMQEEGMSREQVLDFIQRNLEQFTQPAPGS